MSVINVPKSIRLSQRTNWRLVTTSTSSGRGLDGRQQIITRENRYWACEYLVLDAWGKGTSWGEYMAFLDQLNGMGGMFRVPVPNINAAIPQGAGDLFLFDDATMGFETSTNNAAVYDGNPNIEVSATAPAGATQVSTTDLDAFMAVPGTHFSHKDFLYRVVYADAGIIKFNPPLRSQIESGQLLNVAAPRCMVRLSSDEAGMSAHEFSQIGGPYVGLRQSCFLLCNKRWRGYPCATDGIHAGDSVGGYERRGAVNTRRGSYSALAWQACRVSQPPRNSARTDRHL